MTDVNTSLAGNAIKCMDLMHRILSAWLVLSLIAAFLPSSADDAQLRLPFTEITVPINSARWACAVVIFFAGFIVCAILKQLRELCVFLEQSEYLQVVLSYPALATLGAPWQRAFVGYGLAFIQYSVGYQLFSPMPPMFGSAPDIGLAFLYSGPMFLVAWELRDWQRRIKLPGAVPTSKNIPA